MIRITVELISAVAPERNKLLGVAEISNTGGKTAATRGALGDYHVRLYKAPPKAHEIWRGGKVEAFDRVSRGVWDLMFLALRNVVGGRNP